MKNAKQFRKLASSNKGNIAKKFRKRMLKGSKWPSVYYAKIRNWSPKQNNMVRTWMAFLLPHELIKTLLLKSTKSDMLIMSSSVIKQCNITPWHLAYV